MNLRLKVKLDPHHQARIFQVAVRVSGTLEQASRSLVQRRVRARPNGSESAAPTCGLTIVVGVEIGTGSSVVAASDSVEGMRPT